MVGPIRVVQWWLEGGAFGAAIPVIVWVMRSGEADCREQVHVLFRVKMLLDPGGSASRVLRLR